MKQHMHVLLLACLAMAAAVTAQDFSQAEISCQDGYSLFEYPVLLNVTYNAVEQKVIQEADIVTFGEFDGLQARYKSGYITCDTDVSEGREFEYAWQGCSLTESRFTAHAFALSVGYRRIIASGIWEHDSACTPLDTQPNVNGPITCTKQWSVQRGDNVYLGWHDTFNNFPRGTDAGGEITIDLYGMRCELDPSTGEMIHADIGCGEGLAAFSYPILTNVAYGAVEQAIFHSAEHMFHNFGEFDGLQARYKSGYITCDTNVSEGREFEYAWQGCSLTESRFTAHAFALSVGYRRIIASGIWEHDSACTPLDTQPNVNGPITCTKQWSVQRGDNVYLGWHDTFTNFPRGTDAGGEITIDLYGLRCETEPICVPVTATPESAISTHLANAGSVLDGVIDNSLWRSEATGDVAACSSLRSVTVDMGSLVDITQVTYWQYFGDARHYCNQAVDLSSTGEFAGEEQRVFECSSEATKNIVLDLDGISGYLDLGQTDYGGDLSFVAHVFVRSVKHWARIVELNNGMDTDMFIFGFRDITGKLTVESFPNRHTKRGVTAPDPLPLNQWVHVVATIETDGDDAVARIYQDGVEVANGVVHAIQHMRRQNNFLGKSIYPWDQLLDARVSDFQILTKALTADEVAALANQDASAILNSGGEEAFSLGSVQHIPSSVVLPCWSATDHPTFHGGASLVEVDEIQVLDLDGDCEYLDLGPTTCGEDLTFVARVFVRRAGRWARIIEMGNGMETQMMLLGFRGETGQLTFEAFENGGDWKSHITAADPLPLNQWVHVAVTLEARAASSAQHPSAMARLYIDGEEIHSGAVYRSPSIERAYSYIGKSIYPHDEYFDGRIAEFQLFERALSAAEVLDLFRGVGPGASAPRLLSLGCQSPDVHEGWPATYSPIFRGGSALVDDGQCPNTSQEGQVVSFDPTPARFVRVGSSRSNRNTGIHILEVDVKTCDYAIPDPTRRADNPTSLPNAVNQWISRMAMAGLGAVGGLIVLVVYSHLSGRRKDVNNMKCARESNEDDTAGLRTPQLGRRDAFLRTASCSSAEEHIDAKD